MSTPTREQILNMPASPEMDALVQRTFVGYSSVRKPWSTDIAAAMEMEDEMKAPAMRRPYIEELLSICSSPPDCTCDLGVGACDACWFAVAHASSLDRCRAALLATLED